MKEVIIKPKYYDKFKCAANKCLYSCCINWSIPFDNEAIRKYGYIEDTELSEYILNNISTITKKVNLKKGYCPFLDNDSLCKIQKSCGEDYLCETCKNFPRISLSIGNITKFDINIACPEVLKLIKKAKIFSDEYVVEFKDDECELLKIGKDNKKYFIELFNKLKFIYNKNYNYKKSMFILLNFAKDSETFINKKTDKNFEIFKNNFDEQYFLNLAKKYKYQKNKDFLNSFYSNLFDFTEENLINKKMLTACLLYKELNLQNKETVKQMLQFEKLTDKLLNIKNLLFYIINLTIIESIKEGSFLNNVKFAIANIAVLQMLAITQKDITKQKTNENLFILTSCIFRSTYHSDIYEEINKYFSTPLFDTEKLIKYSLSI